jgi:hypothetical protein
MKNHFLPRSYVDPYHFYRRPRDLRFSHDSSWLVKRDQNGIVHDILPAATGFGDTGHPP